MAKRGEHFSADFKFKVGELTVQLNWLKKKSQ